jgi:predicted dinucleotide-binding enzyme
MHVTIIGPGNMGRALTSRFLAGGNQVALVGDQRQAEEVAAEFRAGAGDQTRVEAAEAERAIPLSEVVILALPYEVTLEVAPEYAPLLSGKVVVDISNPLDESYTRLVTENGPSAAETIRALLPPDARLVKAFNTTFARTLVTGEVSGQQLDVFIAGDDGAANGKVAELVRGGGMRPILVGDLSRARQLEALGFLGITLQESLGTGFMTGWKLLLPGMAATSEGRGFPRNAVVGVLKDTSAVGQIVTELAAAGIQQDHVQLLTGPEGAAILRSANQSGVGFLGSLFGYEGEHTRRHLNEVDAGHTVAIVEVADDKLGERAGAVLVRHGATFVNYYSRWTARSLQQ